GPQQRRRRAQGADGVEAAELTVAQREGGPDLAGEQRDEESLPDTGAERHEHAEAEQATVRTEERERQHAPLLEGRGSAEKRRTCAAVPRPVHSPRSPVPLRPIVRPDGHREPATMRLQLMVDRLALVTLAA